ncbi:MAG: hypothetical protein IMF11_03075 [Proteobacteria bacterium]|nr:hypothetical protein [Pseudomonadota bacterium]
MAKHKQTSRPAETLFADNQIDMFEKSYEERLQAEKNSPVECLGMTNEMLYGEPKPDEVLPEFYKFIAGSILVAHNASFDIRIRICPIINWKQ